MQNMSRLAKLRELDRKGQLGSAVSGDNVFLPEPAVSNGEALTTRVHYVHNSLAQMSVLDVLSHHQHARVTTMDTMFWTVASNLSHQQIPLLKEVLGAC